MQAIAFRASIYFILAFISDKEKLYYFTANIAPEFYHLDLLDLTLLYNTYFHKLEITLSSGLDVIKSCVRLCKFFIEQLCI